MRRLLVYFQRRQSGLWWGFLFLLLSAGFSLAKPLIVGNAVDAVTTGFVQSELVRFGLLYVAVAAAQGIFLYFQRWTIIGTSRKIEYDIRGDFYDHLQTLPQSFYARQRTGDLMSRATNDLSAVRMLAGPAVMHSLSAVIVVLGSFIMMYRISPSLATVALVAVPLVAITAKYFGELIHDRTKIVQDYFGEISSAIQENLAGARVVRAFSQEDNQQRAFREMNRGYVDRSRKLITVTATFRPVLELLIGLVFAGIFWFGMRKILAGSISLGEFVALQFYLMRMIWPLIAIGWVINLFQRGLASMRRLSEVWDVAGDDRTDRPLAAPPPRRPDTPEIEVRNLSFGYGGANAIEDISFRVMPGHTLGIVGRTGSGKSTLISLLAGIWDAPLDSIFIRGVPIEQISLETLREMLALVPQDTFLFSDTIAENIRFGRASASDSEVERVVDLAGLGGDIASFPKGLETMIGERGITLSGGQKQRTAIARAIVRSPDILILDDALSAVDTETEDTILRSMRQVREGRTVIVVAHRVSSVKDADQILVLEEGRIVERGDHETLLKRDGFYASLYRKQTLEIEIEEIA
ncbi:MAG: ABC transporter ATP-binding protein/permease [Acidobacteria bacterium]|nr:ABC transporter ATP-binding protein/permease [Acidobacteriota bacterium]